MIQFHADSKHTIDGKHMDAVVHFVHRSKDGELTVIGILINTTKKLGAVPF